MGYVLDITDVAAEDLLNLIESIPAARRRDATSGVEAALERLAANPKLAQPRHLARPTYHFQFVADGVKYHWGCTYAFSEDETSLHVTHIFAVSL